MNIRVAVSESCWRISHRPGRPSGGLLPHRRHPGGARFTFEHTGFTGPGGFVMARLLGAVRRKMLAVGLAAVLDDLDETGTLRDGSRLRPKPA